MRLAVLNLIVAWSVAALLQCEQRVRYASLPADERDPNLELIFSNSLFRHGDRAEGHAVPGCDQFTEDDWTFGGGGYGELSPAGMKTLFNIGRKIRKRYVDDYKILSSAYTAKEVYIRSTDYNRTLISAYASVAGMYSGFGVAGLNFPSKEDLPDWPVNYIPIPVHTVDYDTDYVLHPDSPCPRQDQLKEMIANSAEYQNYVKDPQVVQVLKYLSDTTGTDVTFENLQNLQDPIFCQSNHIEELNQTGAKIEDFYPWYYSGDIPSLVDSILDVNHDFLEGDGNPAGVNGIDMSVEIPKIRAGEMLKLIVGNVHGVLSCRDNSNSDSCRHFYKQLRYYALSAHDTSVGALLTLLGVRNYVIPKSVPYSATILLEVYEDRTTKERFFKVLYLTDPDGHFKSVTAFVRGCDPTKNICPLSVLDDLVKTYAPETDMVTWCNTPVETTSQSSTAKPGPKNPDETTTVKTTSTTTHQPTTTTSSASSISLLVATSVFLFAFLF